MSILDTLLGRPLATDEDSQEKLGIADGIPTFGVDALSSAAYGPEAALTILLPAAAAGVAYILPISLTIIALLGIVFFSYRQTIDAYPNGGGSYTVASENLGHGVGLLAAAALMIDYVLEVAVGIAAGVGALVSAVPALAPHTLGLCLLILLLLTVVNLRGMRESGVLFMFPTYLFVVCLLGLLAWGTIHAWLSGGHPQPVVAPPHGPGHAVAAVGVWLLIRAFSSGCTALTGVEAVSNGVNAFKEPSSQTARHTLGIIVLVLAIMLAGIAHLTRVYGIVATEPGSANYQSLLSMLTAAIVGKGVIYSVTIASTLLLLALSANTAFAGFPRLCRTVAEDGYLPRFFALRGRRLVYTEGIVALALFAGLILIAFDGVTDRLIPLFAIGAFVAFTLSQTGMVEHWRRNQVPRSGLYLAINATGAIATGITVVVVLIAKFTNGAWITVLVIPVLILLMRGVNRHYRTVEAEEKIDHLEIGKEAPPVAILPISDWNRVSQAALQFACNITPDVQVLHIDCPEDDGSPKDGQPTPEASEGGWRAQVQQAATAAGIPQPKLVSVSSPYRFIVTPIVQYVFQTERELPDRKIAVVVPELVAARWYQALLYNHRSTVLKALLLVKGNRRIVVINVPWYLHS